MSTDAKHSCKKLIFNVLCTDLSELEGPKSFEGAYKYILKCTLRQMYESFYSFTPNVSFKFACLYIENLIMLVYSKWVLKNFDWQYYFGPVSFIARKMELRFVVLLLFVFDSFSPSPYARLCVPKSVADKILCCHPKNLLWQNSGADPGGWIRWLATPL